MHATELMLESFRALGAHRLRSSLTLLGIVIGIATLVGVISVISGLNAFVEEKIIRLSPDVFVVTKLGVITSREGFLEALKRKDISWSDYELLAERLRRAVQIAVDVYSTSAVKYRDRRLADIQLHGTTANYGAMMSIDLISGRYFVVGEERAAQAVAVIGWGVKQELFPHMDPVGRTLRVGGRPYRVVGLVAEQGRTIGPSLDTQVFVPVNAYLRQLGSRDSLDLLIRARGGVAGLEDAIDEVRGVLRALRHTDFRAPDPFGIVTAESLRTLWQQISAAAFILSVLIASVSLGISGIVITNTMLVAVVERTREIGVRLALGARKRDIRRQFLTESALLSLTGGLAGVLIGAVVALGVRGLLDFPASVTPGTVVLGLALSAVVGIAAGYWPARNASNLPVVDALRAE